MRKIPYRTSLPLIAGLVALALMFWGIRVDQQCIGYDAGRPFWPCETPDSLLELIAAPAIAVGQGLSNIWATAPGYFNYAIQFPCILLLWWFLGSRIDLGLLGTGEYRKRRLYATLMAVSSAMLIGLLCWSLWEEIKFHQKFSSAANWGYFRIVADLRSLPAYLWLAALAVGFGVAAFRVFRGRTGQIGKILASPWTKRIAALGLTIYALCVTGACLHSRAVERRQQAEVDLHSVIIKGNVVDDRGLPVSAIEVDLVPILENSDLQALRKVATWTDENGDYTLRPESTGRFFLSVLWKAPPSSKLPFLTRFYHDAPDQLSAEIFEITPALHLNLDPIRLHRLQLVKVPVSVAWSNGKPEPNAYLFFSNTQFPGHGSIGDETLHVEDDGKVLLPAGFDYKASAQVECDGGEVIAHPYTPEVTLSTKPTDMPTSTVNFILPGKPCRVWHPQ